MNKILVSSKCGILLIPDEAITYLKKKGILVYSDLEVIEGERDSDGYLPRHNKDLIEAIESLGETKMKRCGLRIETIEGNRYYIQYSEGIESVITEKDFIVIKDESK